MLFCRRRTSWHCCQDAHRLLCTNTSEQHVQLHFDSAWTAVRALDQTWTCVQGTVDVGSCVRELLALLRSEEQWIVESGYVNTAWGDMECVDGSTTEAQLLSTATISIDLWEDDADRSAARVRWLRLLRHLPHLKGLSIDARGHIMGDREAAALTDALQHRELQVQSCARGPSNCTGSLARRCTVSMQCSAPAWASALVQILAGRQLWCVVLRPHCSTPHRGTVCRNSP